MKKSILVSLVAAALGFGCSGSSSGDPAVAGSPSNPAQQGLPSVAIQSFKGTWTGEGRRVVTTQNSKSSKCKTAITLNEITPTQFELSKSQSCENTESFIDSLVLDIIENKIYYNNRVVGNVVNGLINFIIEENGFKSFTRLQIIDRQATYEFQSTSVSTKIVETASLAKRRNK